MNKLSVVSSCLDHLHKLGSFLGFVLAGNCIIISVMTYDKLVTKKAVSAGDGAAATASAVRILPAEASNNKETSNGSHQTAVIRKSKPKFQNAVTQERSKVVNSLSLTTITKDVSFILSPKSALNTTTSHSKRRHCLRLSIRMSATPYSIFLAG